MINRLASVATLAVLTLGAVTSQGLAQAPDWAAAGGGLFPGVASEPQSPAGEVRPDVPTQVPAPEQPFDQVIREAAGRYGLDPKLLHALVVVESAYDPQAVSAAGAAGLAQLMPGTGAELGIADRFDPVQNLDGGAAYLARQLVRFGDLRLALAAYNAGPARVARLGRIPQIQETRRYVDAVVECYLALTAGRPVRNARACRSTSQRARPDPPVAD